MDEFSKILAQIAAKPITINVYVNSPAAIPEGILEGVAPLRPYTGCEGDCENCGGDCNEETEDDVPDCDTCEPTQYAQFWVILKNCIKAGMPYSEDGKAILKLMDELEMTIE